MGMTSRNAAPPLACTVRDCGLLLERRGRTWSCARDHSYDVARSGYLNLLQPTDRRSLNAGDARDAVEARARLLAAGVGRSILEGLAERARRDLPHDAVVVDLGCGSGELLARICGEAPSLGVGIDLSAPAVELAARHYPGLTWVVGNADRRLPLLDRSVDAVVSLHGRRNSAECARVLTRSGHLLIAVPAADDLKEVRAAVQGRAVERDRGEGVIAEFAGAFTLLERFELREQHRLAPDALRDVLRGTYRGERRSATERLAALEALGGLEVTFASEVFVFARVP